jgi:hypothetical protein
VLFLCICLPGLAQETGGQIEALYTRDPSQPRDRVRVRPPRATLPPVSGAPYSAERRQTQDDVRPDGTKIHLDLQTLRFYRDSQGRTRIDTMAPRDSSQLLYFEIQDPIAGFYYFVDPIKQIAYRLKYTGPAPKPLAPARPPILLNHEVLGGVQQTMEAIGGKSFNGVQTEGVRRTWVYPVGYQGRDKASTEVSEYWRASSLGFNVYSQTKRPGSISIMELANLSAVDPRLDLFLVPGGFLVEDREGEFVIDVGFLSAAAASKEPAR